jgi:hypothetical protein
VTLLATIAIAGAWVLGANTLASIREKASDHGWTEAGLPMDTITALYPTTGLNEAAVKLVAIAAQLGIDATPFGDTAGAHPPAPDAEPFDALNLPKFVELQVMRGDDIIQPAPQNIVDFYTAHAETLAALKAVSRGGAIWPMDLDWHFAAPGPNFGGIRRLVAVLLGDALEHARSGNSTAALDSLEAAWQISESLPARPELLLQVLGIAMEREMLGALRKIPAVTPEWRTRIRDHDYRKSLLRSFQAEAWIVSDFARRTNVSMFSVTGTAAERRLRMPLDRPYLRLSASNSSDMARRAVADLSGQDPCTLDIAAFDATAKTHVPRWNRLGRNALPRFSRIWKTAARLALETELTGKVLDARLQGAGAGSSPSVVCSELTWTWQSTADGLTITANEEFLGEMLLKDVPLGFTIKPSASSQR